MATTSLTLTCGGLEMSLADWGFAQDGCVLTLENLGDDTLTLSMPGALVTDNPVFPFEAAITLQSGRSGSGTVWTGGKVEFAGKRVRQILDGRPNFEGVLYTFAGPWYDLRSTPYQQANYYWKYANGTIDTVQAELSSDVILFFKVTAQNTSSKRNNGQQIQDILQHVLDQCSANGQSAPFQIGTIDPAVELATYEAQDIKCAEAIEHCLRCSPDARLWFDYSFTPPKANVTSRANCTTASVPLADGVSHESISLVPRPDLQAASVVILFKQTNSSNGVQWVQKTKQKYPSNGPDGGLRVIVQTVDLQGFSVSNVYGSLKVQAVANSRAWWSRYLPELQSSKIRAFTLLSGMTIIDDDGNAVSLASFPNACIDGSSVAPWMTVGGNQVIGKQVTITALASYKQYDQDASGDTETSTNGVLTTVFPSRQLSAKVTLTNGVTGNYSALASAVDAEAIPSNLAQSIYTSLATLQYEGALTFVEAEITSAITMGHKLNITGGRTEWATMGAQIQSIRRDWGSGRTTYTLGPSRQLSAGDLTALFLLNRFRRTWTNPSLKASGQSTTSQTSVTLPQNVTRENSNAGLDFKSLGVDLFTNADGTKNLITRDAQNGQLSLIKLNADGTPAVNGGKVVHDLADLTETSVDITKTVRGGQGLTGKFRRIHFTDTSGAAMVIKGLVSEAVPDFNPTASSADDIFLGGSGGTPKLMAITGLVWTETVNGTTTTDPNYWTCVDAAGTTYKVLKPISIRPSKVYDNIDYYDSYGNHSLVGVVYGYGNNYCARSVTAQNGQFPSTLNYLTPSVQAKVTMSCVVQNYSTHDRVLVTLATGTKCSDILTVGQYVMFSGILASASPATNLTLCRVLSILSGSGIDNQFFAVGDSSIQTQTGQVSWGFGQIHALKNSIGEWIDLNDNGFAWAEYPYVPPP